MAEGSEVSAWKSMHLGDAEPALGRAHRTGGGGKLVSEEGLLWVKGTFCVLRGQAVSLGR